MTRILILATALCLSVASFAGAERTWRDYMVTRYNIPQTSKLNTCDTCHGSGNSLNLYGDQLAQAGIANDVAAAFDATDDLNADGDPALNWVELVNGTWPADATDYVPVDNATWGKIKALYH